MIALLTTSTLLSLLFWLAIIAIVVWAVIALVKASGVPIPQPVWIILTAVVGIALILLIAKLFGILV